MRVTIATDGFLEPDVTPAMQHEIVFAPHDDFDALAAALAESDALVTRRVQVTRELLRTGPRLRLVQQVGVGTDRIDFVAARGLGIQVANTPEATSNAVVEHTFMMVLAALRGLVFQVNAMRNGGWSGTEVWEGEEIAGKTVGIIGFGSIGRDLGRRFVLFGANVLSHTRTVPVDMPAGIAFVSLQELLERSDILIVAVSLNDTTRGLLGNAELLQMKRSALLVNIARGAVIEEQALVEAIRANRLRAALDAYVREPLPNDSPLRTLPNVLPTPHSAGSSRQSRERIWSQMLDNLDRLAERRGLRNIVDGKV